MLCLTPRQRRLVRPLRNPAPLCRLALVAFALAIGPLARIEAGIAAYHRTLLAAKEKTQ
jgi:hypothetical protein